ncbi:MAG: hypothetical protein IPO21_10095 [Bacteroidales bacterium]|nr:hypothetical protein [Bacteroidales bacterium]
MNLVPYESPNVALRAAPGSICEKTLTTFISDSIYGAGLQPRLEWLINGKTLSTQAAYLSTDTLSAGTEVMVVVHSNAQCLFPKTDTAWLVVNPKPQPEVTVTPHLQRCSTHPDYRARPAQYRGSYEFYTTQGIEKEASAAYFNPNLLADGNYPIGVEWTNRFGCKAKASTSIEVHSIGPPIAKESYHSIIGYLPYDELTASGIGSLKWYDSNKNPIGEGAIYKPTLDCNSSECRFTFYVNQILEPWGCVSPYVPVVYTLTGCPVGTPTVTDYKICDYNPIPSLHADTAKVWTGSSSIRGTSTLHWYNYYTDATENYIHSGLSNFQPPFNNTVGEYAWWVRQYNTTLGHSSPVKVKLTIINTPPPTIENSPQSYCQGQETPSEFVANGENIEWYLEPDTSSAVFKSGNNLLPEIPSDWQDYYYASQTKNGCKSPPVPANISIMPKAQTPTLQGGESCDQAERYFMVALFPLGTSVQWFDHNGILLKNRRKRIHPAAPVAVCRQCEHLQSYHNQRL